jgi:hypothetical protein
MNSFKYILEQIKTEWWQHSQFISSIKRHYSTPRRRLRWVRRVACMGVMQNEYNISNGKHEWKTICGQLRHRQQDNNKKLFGHQIQLLSRKNTYLNVSSYYSQQISINWLSCCWCKVNIMQHAVDNAEDRNLNCCWSFL